MRRSRLDIATTLGALALIALPLAIAEPSPAEARSDAPPAGQFVNVSVSFNTRTAIPEDDEKALAAAQRSGRQLVYRVARSECGILKATIAKTCRLTGLNVSTQIRPARNATPATLVVNGSAHFAITLDNAADDSP